MIPQDIKKALVSEDTDKVIESIVFDFKLSEDQKNKLNPETGSYMLGKTKEDRYVPNLMYSMDINRATAEEIKERVDREIIDPIRESFEKAQAEDLFAQSGIEVQKETEDTQEQQSGTPATKESVLNDIEDPLHSNQTTSEPDEYSNHAPLNVIKDDVMQGIEDPETHNEPENSGEGTELDMQLDRILRKPRGNGSLPPSHPQNLPTEPTDMQPKFAEQHNQTKEIPTSKPEQAPTKPANTSKPSSTSYENGVDPYREPIE